MQETNLDELLRLYRQATESWIEAIRTEEALATPDHSMTQTERWDTAGLAIHGSEAGA